MVYHPIHACLDKNHTKWFIEIIMGTFGKWNYKKEGWWLGFVG